jgi:hypothetical protein
MKSTFSLRGLVVLFSFCTCIVSCSKDPVAAPLTPLPVAPKISTDPPPPPTGPSAKIFGQIWGIILPQDAKAELVIYNAETTTGSFFPNRDGSFLQSYMPAGMYTLTIHPNNPIYTDKKIDSIVVIPGQIVKLGKIYL